MENQKEQKFTFYLYTLLKISGFFVFTYIFLVLVSHISVYMKTPEYKFSDSIKALFNKTDVPSNFFIIFGLLMITIPAIAVLVNYLIRKFSNKSK